MHFRKTYLIIYLSNYLIPRQLLDKIMVMFPGIVEMMIFAEKSYFGSPYPKNYTTLKS